MAAARIQYPCHGCGIHGHWKKDGQCNPVDVANYIKRRMAEQNKKEAEDEEEITGMTIYIFRIQLYPFSNNLTHSFGHISRFNFLMFMILFVVSTTCKIRIAKTGNMLYCSPGQICICRI